MPGVSRSNEHCPFISSHFLLSEFEIMTKIIGVVDFFFGHCFWKTATRTTFCKTLWRNKRGEGKPKKYPLVVAWRKIYLRCNTKRPSLKSNVIVWTKKKGKRDVVLGDFIK